MQGVGMPTPHHVKSTYNFIVGFLNPHFCILGFKQPWIVQYCGTYLLEKKKKVWVGLANFLNHDSFQKAEI